MQITEKCFKQRLKRGKSEKEKTGKRQKVGGKMGLEEKDKMKEGWKLGERQKERKCAEGREIMNKMVE